MKPAHPLADVLEKDWQRQVRELAETLGYRRYHTFDSRRSDTGFPDLVLVSAQRKRVVYLELKREQGRLTPSQADWIRDLAEAGAEVYVARPRNLQDLADVLIGHRLDARFAEPIGRLLIERDRALEKAA